MGLFHKDTNEPSLACFNEKTKALLASDSFISKKQVGFLRDEFQDTVRDIYSIIKRDAFDSWCKNKKYSKNLIRESLDTFKNLHAMVDNHNEEYVKRHLVEDKQYLDTVLKESDPGIQLDDEQRSVILRDEDYTLVVAGAGSGKTTTLAAKVKYLVDKKGVDPKRILIVSFTREATNELKDRIQNQLGIPASISTFHSIGYHLLKDEDGERKRVVDDGYLYNVIYKMLKENDDEDFRRDLLLFFASYLNPEMKDIDVAEYKKIIERNDYQSMRSDIKISLDTYKSKLAENKVSIQGERMASQQEVSIANFLFINGIEYEYEPIYPFVFGNSLKPYTPDFLIKQGEKVFYLEHFGISEDGQNSRFSEQELTNYKKCINDKIKLHREHGTKLLYTFSSYKDERDLIEHLKDILVQNGFIFERRNDKEIYDSLFNLVEQKYFHKLITLVKTFINGFGTKCYTNSKFDEWDATVKNARTKKFLSIVKKCYFHYQYSLEQDKALDFNGMINKAVALLDDFEKRNVKLPFDYIFVDEYQDVSAQRFNLCQRLSKVSDAKIIAVGDDWQAIFRFAGSDVGLFYDFESVMGYCDLLKITNTYRNAQQLIDIAAGFVQKNEKQIKKELHSKKNIEKPMMVISYDDSPKDYKNPKDVGPMRRSFEAVERALDEIHLDKGDKGKVLFIGRYNFDGKSLDKSDGKFTYDMNTRTVKSSKYPDMNITFMTAHASKGLTYDNVVVLNMKDAILGFPSRIEEDPIIKLIMAEEDDNIEFAEERRLFYVAMTRTKNKLYMVTPENHASVFVTEIMENNTTISLRGNPVMSSLEFSAKHECPICGYPLQLRQNTKYGSRIYVCTNDSEICGYITNNLGSGKMHIIKCPKCIDGYLIAKRRKDENGKGQIFMGCNNFEHKKCNYALNPWDYTDNVGDLALRGDYLPTTFQSLEFDGIQLSQWVGMVYDCIQNLISRHIGISARDAYFMLTGDESKFKNRLFIIEGNSSYGICSKKKSLSTVIKSMISSGMLDIDATKYKNVSPVTEKDMISDGEYKVLFESIKKCSK